MPFSVFVSSQASRISNSGGGQVLATVIDQTINTSCGSGAVDLPCFSKSQFATVGSSNLGYGNYARNSFRAPGYFDLDLNASKSFAVTEKVRLAVGASFYNLLNHPNFDSPGYNSNTSGLGVITATVSAPTSPYGSFQGSAVSGRVVVSSIRLTF